jgi:lipopolysaccharide export system permease protein
MIAVILIRNRINPSVKWWRRQLPAFLGQKWNCSFHSSMSAT